MFKKIFVFSLIIVIGLLNSRLAYAGFFDGSGLLENNFSASSLYLEITDTADNPFFVPAFYTSDLKPGDSKSTTFRINKRGTEDFRYNIYSIKTGGDDNLCSYLQIEAKLDGASYYSGSLLSLSINPRPTITEGIDQWELTLSLVDSSAELREKNCSFDIVVKGWQTDSDGTWGFFDSKGMGSSVSTTTWEPINISLMEEGSENGSGMKSLDTEEGAPSAKMNPETPNEAPDTETLIEEAPKNLDLPPLTPSLSPEPKESGEQIEQEIKENEPTKPSISDNGSLENSIDSDSIGEEIAL